MPIDSSTERDREPQRDGEQGEPGPDSTAPSKVVPREEVNDVLPLPWDDGSTELSADQLNGEAPD